MRPESHARWILAGAMAVIAAALAPALVFGAVWVGMGGGSADFLAQAMAACGLVAFAHALVLGAPVAAWLVRRRTFSIRSMPLAGAIVGLVPTAILAFPYDHGANTSIWSDGAWKVKDGVPTLAGWMDYLQVLLWVGALGAIGGVAFYAVYRCVRIHGASAPPEQALLPDSASR